MDPRGGARRVGAGGEKDVQQWQRSWGNAPAGEGPRAPAGRVQAPGFHLRGMEGAGPAAGTTSQRLGPPGWGQVERVPFVGPGFAFLKISEPSYVGKKAQKQLQRGWRTRPRPAASKQ